MIKDMQSAPTEIDLMQDTIGVLTNSTAPPEEILLALEALQSLVEPIDNANGWQLKHIVFLALCVLMSLLMHMIAVHSMLTNTNLACVDSLVMHLNELVQQASYTAVMCERRLTCLVQSYCCSADLHTLHGLQPVVQLLSQDSASLQAAAAFVLGTAASNNNRFQEQLMQLHPESISLLMQVHLLMSCCLAKLLLTAMLCFSIPVSSSQAGFTGHSS